MKKSRGRGFESHPGHLDDNMIDRSLARILGFLMGDGCLYKCRERLTPRESHREHGSRVGYAYRIEFYNKNAKLLTRFSKDMFSVFGKKPIFNPKKFRVRISSNKQIFQALENLAKFSSSNWEIPLDKLNKETALEWLSAFIDSEGYIENDSVQRHKRIIITSINLKGLKQIQKLLYDFFNISSKIYGPYDGIYRITISGICNLFKLKNMKLNHPMKMKTFSVILNN